MSFLKLQQFKDKALYIASFEKYVELAAAKVKVLQKGFSIEYAGSTNLIKPYQAARWVLKRPSGYLNYSWEITDTRLTGLTALGSLHTALDVLGGYEWILIWQQ